MDMCLETILTPIFFFFFGYPPARELQFATYAAAAAKLQFATYAAAVATLCPLTPCASTGTERVSWPYRDQFHCTAVATPTPIFLIYLDLSLATLSCISFCVSTSLPNGLLPQHLPAQVCCFFFADSFFSYSLYGRALPRSTLSLLISHSPCSC